MEYKCNEFSQQSKTSASSGCSWEDAISEEERFSVLVEEASSSGLLLAVVSLLDSSSCFSQFNSDTEKQLSGVQNIIRNLLPEFYVQKRVNL